MLMPCLCVHTHTRMHTELSSKHLECAHTLRVFFCCVQWLRGITCACRRVLYYSSHCRNVTQNSPSRLNAAHARGTLSKAMKTDTRFEKKMSLLMNSQDDWFLIHQPLREVESIYPASLFSDINWLQTDVSSARKPSHYLSRLLHPNTFSSNHKKKADEDVYVYIRMFFDVAIEKVSLLAT